MRCRGIGGVAGADRSRFVLHGSRMADETGRVTVIISPATPLDVVELLLGGYGLTARESEVAGLVLRGRSTAQISAALFITAYTVQDHLKAIRLSRASVAFASIRSSRRSTARYRIAREFR